jgi:hypothetical protein
MPSLYNICDNDTKVQALNATNKPLWITDKKYNNVGFMRSCLGYAK